MATAGTPTLAPTCCAQPARASDGRPPITDPVGSPLPGNPPVGSGRVGSGPVGSGPVGRPDGTAVGATPVGAAEASTATGRGARIAAGTSSAPAAAVAATSASRKTPGRVSRPLGRRDQARVARAAEAAARRGGSRTACANCTRRRRAGSDAGTTGISSTVVFAGSAAPVFASSAGVSALDPPAGFGAAGSPALPSAFGSSPFVASVSGVSAVLPSVFVASDFRGLGLDGLGLRGPRSSRPRAWVPRLARSTVAWSAYPPNARSARGGEGGAPCAPDRARPPSLPAARPAARPVVTVAHACRPRRPPPVEYHSCSANRQIHVPWVACPGTSSAAAPAATPSRSTVRWRRPVSRPAAHRDTPTRSSFFPRSRSPAGVVPPVVPRHPPLVVAAAVPAAADRARCRQPRWWAGLAGNGSESAR